MDHTAMDYIVIAHIGMAYIAIPFRVMAIPVIVLHTPRAATGLRVGKASEYSYGLYSYGLCRRRLYIHGPNRHGLYSHGLYSRVPRVTQT